MLFGLAGVVDGGAQSVVDWAVGLTDEEIFDRSALDCWNRYGVGRRGIEDRLTWIIECLGRRGHVDAHFVQSNERHIHDPARVIATAPTREIRSECQGNDAAIWTF